MGVSESENRRPQREKKGGGSFGRGSIRSGEIITGSNGARDIRTTPRDPRGMRAIATGESKNSIQAPVRDVTLSTKIQPDAVPAGDGEEQIIALLIHGVQQQVNDGIQGKIAVKDLPSGGTTSGEKDTDTNPMLLNPQQRAEFEAAFTKFPALCGAIVSQYHGEVDYATVEDAVAEAYLLAMQKWDSFNDKGSASRLSWIRGFAMNTLRSENRKGLHSSRVVKDPEITELLLSTEKAKGLPTDEAAIQRASPLEQRLADTPHVITLLANTVGGMSQEEIANARGTNRDRIKYEIGLAKDTLLRRAQILPDDPAEVGRQKFAEVLTSGIESASLELEQKTEETPFELQWKPAASVEMQLAGKSFQQARVNSGKSVAKVVEISGGKLTMDRLYRFEKGSASIDLNLIYAAMGEFIKDPQDPFLDEINQLRRGQNMLHAFSQQGMTFGNAIRILPSLLGLSDKVFLKRSSIDSSTFKRYTNGENAPAPDKLSTLLTENGIDPFSLEGQYLHLLRSGLTPLFLADFVKEKPGKQLEHVRTESGFSQSDLARQVHYAQSAVSFYENRAQIIPEEAITIFADACRIPEGSPLRTAMIQSAKGNKYIFSSQDRIDSLSGPHLFGEHIQQANAVFEKAKQEATV